MFSAHGGDENRTSERNTTSCIFQTSHVCGINLKKISSSWMNLYVCVMQRLASSFQPFRGEVGVSSAYLKSVDRKKVEDDRNLRRLLAYAQGAAHTRPMEKTWWWKFIGGIIVNARLRRRTRRVFHKNWYFSTEYWERLMKTHWFLRLLTFCKGESRKPLLSLKCHLPLRSYVTHRDFMCLLFTARAYERKYEQRKETKYNLRSGKC